MRNEDFPCVIFCPPPSILFAFLSPPLTNDLTCPLFSDQILLKYFLPHIEPSIVISCIMTDKLSISSRSSILPLKLATPPTLPTKRCLLEAAFWLTAIRPRVWDQCQKKQPSPRRFNLTTIHRILNCPCSTNFIPSHTVTEPNAHNSPYVIMLHSVDLTLRYTKQTPLYSYFREHRAQSEYMSTQR